MKFTRSTASSVISMATGVQSFGKASKISPTSSTGTCLYALPGSVESCRTLIFGSAPPRITIRAPKPRAALSVWPTLTPSVGLSRAMQAKPRSVNVDFRVTADAKMAKSLADDLRQILGDLGLADEVGVDEE